MHLIENITTYYIDNYTNKNNDNQDNEDDDENNKEVTAREERENETQIQQECGEERESHPHTSKDCHNDYDNEGGSECEHTHTLLIHAEKNIVTVILLEIGISVHSVLIGIALGGAKDEFLALFIALCFHQFFEGIGLGHVLIDNITGKKKRALAIGCAFFYSITTPIGIAIGIGLSNSNNGFQTTTSIITAGILDAVAAGILIYSALVSLLSIIFQSRGFKKQKHYNKVLCFLSFYLGCAMMSILAIWA
jgi:zinc transporter 1/2/3